MKICPICGRSYQEANRFCSVDGAELQVSTESAETDFDDDKEKRRIPAPPEPLPMRLTIIDQAKTGRRSRVIQGLVHDVGKQGMRVQTGTVETGRLNIIRDHTIAFKNKLEVEVDLPAGTVRFTGFAAWYKPVGEGLSWMVGVYIRDMPAADRKAYDEYLDKLESQGEKAKAQS
ncbi:MAG TPA: hypothetical protein VF131_14770 [Blastocatellia bacterium]|nr:hypothetical protein [Blastocatellia bacterium]